ncbi:MAG: alpha/beta fold hydrolase [Firmicutes bacterium]|nr:alpha/beta fold hydrolase [Bacillota bacterium]
MKKFKIAVIGLLVVSLLPTSLFAFAGFTQNFDGVPRRTQNGTEYLALRATAYANNVSVEWEEPTRTVRLTDELGNQRAVVVDNVGGFIEDGTTWIPLTYAETLFPTEPPPPIEALSAITPIETEQAEPTEQTENPQQADNLAIATQFMEFFVAGDLAATFPLMTEELLAVAGEVFPAMYQMALIQRGDLLSFALYDVQTNEMNNTAFDFEITTVIGTMLFRIVVTADGQIDAFSDSLGFTFVPLAPLANATYSAEPIIVGTGTQWALNGMLTIPNAATAENPVPAVVLVHGSGPQNMDQSVFNNRMFHEIASYLSSNGVAVLRYDKRTLTHGLEMVNTFGENLTVFEETIEDAILAAEILQADSRINSVFVAGNSLGGMLAPAIAEQANLDGAILLAGSPRPLFEISYDQNIMGIAALVAEGLMSQQEADETLAMVDAMIAEARNLPNLSESELEGVLIFGMTAIYQRSLMDNLPLPIISRNAIPTLILQGERDFQVLAEGDFDLFVEHTQNYDHVQTILYPNLTHFFMPAQTQFIDLREYMVDNNVEPQVLQDIVNWIFEVLE